MGKTVFYVDPAATTQLYNNGQTYSGAEKEKETKPWPFLNMNNQIKPGADWMEYQNQKRNQCRLGSEKFIRSAKGWEY